MCHLHPCILNAVVVPYSFHEAVKSIKYDFVLWLLYLRNGTCRSDLTNFVSTMLHIHNEPYEYIPTA